jgi:hypothetical protein
MPNTPPHPTNNTPLPPQPAAPPPALDQERGDKQLVGLNRRVYTIGGETKGDVPGVPEQEWPELWAGSEVLDTVEVYDPQGEGGAVAAKWWSLESMPMQLFRFGASKWRRGTSSCLGVRLCTTAITSASAPPTRCSRLTWGV